MVSCTRAPEYDDPQNASTQPRTIFIRYNYCERISFRTKLSVKISTIKRAAASRLGKCEDSLKFEYHGARLYDDEKLSDIPWLSDSDEHRTIDATVEQVGGKPVIYLSSPTEVDATVDLSLVPAWKFSAIFPVVPAEQKLQGQSLTWNVRTHQDGSLTEKATGLDVAYLYWEAQ